ncbi:MAG TPA: tRNA (5-methylaminomethyl-2-thiouridylate)-methyltransferase [Candidatus Didemnitutus sp.]|nr:tRNA (5-methylaminomethyl-2-thiouridylate)-methyltransferase [Candidatus Didemnitutus sp.]
MTTNTYPNSGPITEHSTVRAVQLTLKILFGVVPIVAGADKFTNFLVHWESYLNPHLGAVIAPALFMRIVGVIEIVAGIIVLVKPRIGAYIVTAWLLAIALQLLVQGQYLDVAVRDIVLALGGALTLARLTPFVEAKAG